jgi:hypothetical protein
MYYQTYHEQPIMGGQISRPRGHPWRRARFFGALVQVQPGWDDVGTDNSAAAVRSAIRCQGVRYVAVYKQETGEVTRRRIEQLERDLFSDVAPISEDDVMRVYEVQNEHPAVPYWTLDPDEWHPAEQIAELNTTSRWASGETGSLLLYPCHEQPQSEVLVEFDVFSYGQARTLELVLNGEHLGSVAVPHGWVRRVALPLALQPGENRLELRGDSPAVVPPTAVEEAQNDPQAAPRRISFNLSRVSVEALEPHAPGGAARGMNDES